MRFLETPLSGVFVVEPEPVADDRGVFARTWCRREFEARGLAPAPAQCSTSFNHRRGTLRGLHYQRPPFEEAKLVRCTRGAIFDVALDLRPGSPTYLRWAGVELTADSRRALYIPAGLAHGFQTVEDATEVFYQISEFYHPEAAAGVRWDDPAFAIDWPLPAPILSPRDRAYPDFEAGRP